MTDKQSSLLQLGINYGCKKFYGIGPRNDRDEIICCMFVFGLRLVYMCVLNSPTLLPGAILNLNFGRKRLELIS